jgi:glycosyltransferase involved in cell wall biosynthesis
MIKVLHIITDLALGGAETMLYRLLSRMDAARFDNEVISLTDLGTNAENIRAAGVPVHAVGMRKAIPNPFPAIRLGRWIQRAKPQIVHTWMYHANLIGGLAARFATDIPVVWGIHHTDLDPQRNKRLTMCIARVCAWMSTWLPNYVVFCSNSALRSHVKLGYAASKMEIIPNGFDLERFAPDPFARISVREELGIPTSTPLVGIAAHFRPDKDHYTFVQAAERLHAQKPDVHFVLCGIGVDDQNPQLSTWIRAAGLGANCHLLGARRDMPRMFAAMDIATSSSLSEAFPLAIGEAMASGASCVVTNVGDSALIVGETGRVVAARDPDGLARAWRELIEAGPGRRRHLGTAARCRVEQLFGLPAVVERYQSIYAQLVCAPQQGLSSPG